MAGSRPAHIAVCQCWRTEKLDDRYAFPAGNILTFYGARLTAQFGARHVANDPTARNEARTERGRAYLASLSENVVTCRLCPV